MYTSRCGLEDWRRCSRASAQVPRDWTDGKLLSAIFQNEGILFGKDLISCTVRQYSRFHSYSMYAVPFTRIWSRIYQLEHSYLLKIQSYLIARKNLCISRQRIINLFWKHDNQHTAIVFDKSLSSNAVFPPMCKYPRHSATGLREAYENIYDDSLNVFDTFEWSQLAMLSLSGKANIPICDHGIFI